MKMPLLINPTQRYRVGKSRSLERPALSAEDRLDGKGWPGDNVPSGSCKEIDSPILATFGVIGNVYRCAGNRS